MTFARGQGEKEVRTGIDCRDRTAGQALASILPFCREARGRGDRPVVVVHNLELLPDSVTRLLKGLERIARELDARIVLEDRSGLAEAFRSTLSGASRFDPAPAGP